jgi:hypothetical protein
MPQRAGPCHREEFKAEVVQLARCSRSIQSPTLISATIATYF